jgi:hypothetical protein
MIPDVVEVGVYPLAVVAGADEGVGGVVRPDLSGAVPGGLATVDGLGLIAAWLEQAAQNPNKIAIAAFLIEASFL